VRYQLRLSSHLHAARDGTGAAFARARTDQLALEFG
jgi:hypothetical protein